MRAASPKVRITIFRFLLLLGAVDKTKTQQMISNEITMRRLMGFYEYNRCLLHAQPEFLGYDPVFSIPLDVPEVDAPDGGNGAQLRHRK